MVSKTLCHPPGGDYSDDADAAWLRKGNRAYYGYKIHAATDSQDGFVLGGHATPANRSDTGEFVRVLDEVDARTGESLYADKGYSSQLNRYVLQIRGLSDGIMHKAARNRELTLAQRATNRLISSVRAKVERVFGTLKRGYGFFRARYSRYEFAEITWAHARKILSMNFEDVTRGCVDIYRSQTAIAATWRNDKYAMASLSYRVAILLNCLILLNMRSIAFLSL